MGSAAPLVQPVEPGQTVPGAAPSSKFTKENDPPPPILATRAAPSSGDAGSLLWSHEARSTTAARTIAVRECGTWRFTGQPPFLDRTSSGLDGLPRGDAQVVYLCDCSESGRDARGPGT